MNIMFSKTCLAKLDLTEDFRIHFIFEICLLYWISKLVLVSSVNNVLQLHISIYVRHNHKKFTGLFTFISSFKIYSFD